MARMGEVYHLLERRHQYEGESFHSNQELPSGGKGLLEAHYQDHFKGHHQLFQTILQLSIIAVDGSAKAIWVAPTIPVKKAPALPANLSK